MSKFSTAGLLAFTIAGTSLAWSQQAAAPTPQPVALTSGAPTWTAEDTAAFTDARLAALKAGLALRADQQKNWDAFEKAYRNLAKEQSERTAKARSAPPPADAVDLLRRRADAMSASATDLRQLADAEEPLYRGLDDSQKRRMAAMTASR